MCSVFSEEFADGELCLSLGFLLTCICLCLLFLSFGFDPFFVHASCTNATSLSWLQQRVPPSYMLDPSHWVRLYFLLFLSLSSVEKSSICWLGMFRSMAVGLSRSWFRTSTWPAKDMLFFSTGYSRCLLGFFISSHSSFQTAILHRAILMMLYFLATTPSELRRSTLVVWRVSRALISVALETEEEHLHTIFAGWPVTAESHQRTATKAAESHTLVRHVSRRLFANTYSVWLPESSVWPASHSVWAQHGHPAPGHSDWGQRRITEHRFTAPRHVGTLYLTNKHTLRGLYWTPLAVWFFSPLQYILVVNKVCPDGACQVMWVLHFRWQ